MPHGLPSCRLGPPLIAALLFAGPVHAQIVTDGSVGPKVSLRGGQIEIGADLARIMHVISHLFVVLYEFSTSGRALASPAAAAGLDDFGGLRLTT